MNRRSPWLAAAAAGLVFSLSIAFVVYRVLAPSDGAWLEPVSDPWGADGVRVHPLGPAAAGGLLPGDRVIAAAGRPLNEWAADIFRPGESRPPWRSGAVLDYTVEREGQVLVLPVRLGHFPFWQAARSKWGLALFALVSQLVALFVFLRQPRERSAQLLFLWSFCASNAYTWSLGLTTGDLIQPAGWWLYTLGSFGIWLLFWGVSLHFATVFPHPISLRKRVPGLTPLIYGSVFGLGILGLVVYRLSVPTPLEYLVAFERVGYLVAAVFLSLMVVIILRTYRQERDPSARRQLRWVVYGTVLSGGGGLLLWIIPPLLIGRALVGVNAGGLLLLPFPLTIAAAVLRYRLFDIDVIIKRTLLYGSLTLVLAGVYLVSVVLLQEAFRRLTGADRSPLVTAVSTLAIVALFNPLRLRIQRDIDRRFDRQRYDAEQILESLLPSLRGELELDQLSGEILNIVRQTMHPASLSLMLFRGGKGKEKEATDYTDYTDFHGF